MIGPAGDICLSRPQALLLQYSLRSGSSHVSWHMTLEHMSSSVAWKLSGFSMSLASQRLDSKSMALLYCAFEASVR